MKTGHDRRRAEKRGEAIPQPVNPAAGSDEGENPDNRTIVLPTDADPKEIAAEERCMEADAMEFFAKGHVLLRHLPHLPLGMPYLSIMELLENHALGLMMLGQELEVVAVSEEIIRRCAYLPEALYYMARAHFNAGCAHARVGMIEKAADHLNAIRNVIERIVERRSDHDRLLHLAETGIRHCERLHAITGTDSLRILRYGISQQRR